jgi:hypothetical protein
MGFMLKEVEMTPILLDGVICLQESMTALGTAKRAALVEINSDVKTLQLSIEL